GIGADLDRRRIAAEQHGILGDEPLAGFDAYAGAAAAIACVVLAPEFAPACIHDDGIARLQADVLLFERAFKIGHRHLIGIGEHVDTLVARNVDEYATGHQHADILDAELGEAAAGFDIGSLEAVVVDIILALMREAVELGADLAHF